MNGILKYPWFREPVGDHSKKWGVYLHTEGEQFRWARELFPNDQRRSAEAEVMNFADDVAYAIHDAEDFYRAGLIPLDRLRQDSEERRRFLDAFEDSGRTPAGMDIEELGKKLKNLLRNFFPLIEPYVGTLNQRASLRTFVSLLVGRYVKAVKIQSPRSEKERRLRVSADMQAELKLLQFLTWHYVITKPSLATLQHGQKRVIAGLFEIYLSAVRSENWSILPRRYQDTIRDILANPPKSHTTSESHLQVRAVADVISGMTDAEAVQIYCRFSGMVPGSVLDFYAR